MLSSGLWGLFISSFLASTLLPGGSEAVLVYSLLESDTAPSTLLFIATLGNTLGGLTSWLIGRWLRSKLPGSRLKKPEQLRALERIRQHGAPILLLSWVPVIGDPLCVAAGWARVALLPSLIFIALGKGARYAFIILLVP